jgi:hypothetical protein
LRPAQFPGAPESLVTHGLIGINSIIRSGKVRDPPPPPLPQRRPSFTLRGLSQTERGWAGARLPHRSQGTGAGHGRSCYRAWRQHRGRNDVTGVRRAWHDSCWYIQVPVQEPGDLALHRAERNPGGGALIQRRYGMWQHRCGEASPGEQASRRHGRRAADACTRATGTRRSAATEVEPCCCASARGA